LARLKTKSKRRQSYNIVCEKLKTANIIADFDIKRVDASFDSDGSRMYTDIVITEAKVNPLVHFIENETYGKSSELYIHTTHPNTLWQAMLAAGIDLRKATKQEKRIILPVAFFKGWHWWE